MYASRSSRVGSARNERSLKSLTAFRVKASISGPTITQVYSSPARSGFFTEFRNLDDESNPLPSFGRRACRAGQLFFDPVPHVIQVTAIIYLTNQRCLYENR